MNEPYVWTAPEKRALEGHRFGSDGAVFWAALVPLARFVRHLAAGASLQLAHCERGFAALLLFTPVFRARCHDGAGSRVHVFLLQYETGRRDHSLALVSV